MLSGNNGMFSNHQGHPDKARAIPLKKLRAEAMPLQSTRLLFKVNYEGTKSVPPIQVPPIQWL